MGKRRQRLLLQQQQHSAFIAGHPRVPMLGLCRLLDNGNPVSLNVGDFSKFGIEFF